MISIHTTSRYKLDKKALERSAQEYLEKQGVGSYLVNIAFVGKRKMKTLAKKYVDEDIAKPVLAFPFKDEQLGKSEEPLLGEIVLCYPQVVLLAAERDKTVDKTIAQLVEHGIRNLVK